MFEIFKAGGPLMWVILSLSIIAFTIILERFYSLRTSRVAPKGLTQQIIDLYQEKGVTEERVSALKRHSPLGYILASALEHQDSQDQHRHQSIEESGKQVIHRLSQYLNMLGTVASISPLIGLLGTVIGMIKVFTDITTSGVGDPTLLSGGISEALITTAAGLSVGIPCLMFYRHFKSKINNLSVILEEKAISLNDVIIRDKK